MTILDSWSATPATLVGNGRLHVRRCDAPPARALACRFTTSIYPQFVSSRDFTLANLPKNLRLIGTLLKYLHAYGLLFKLATSTRSYSALHERVSPIHEPHPHFPLASVDVLPTLPAPKHYYTIYGRSTIPPLPRMGSQRKVNLSLSVSKLITITNTLNSRLFVP